MYNVCVCVYKMFNSLIEDFSGERFNNLFKNKSRIDITTEED